MKLGVGHTNEQPVSHHGDKTRPSPGVVQLQAEDLIESGSAVVQVELLPALPLQAAKQDSSRVSGALGSLATLLNVAENRASCGGRTMDSSGYIQVEQQEQQQANPRTLDTTISDTWAAELFK